MSSALIVHLIAHLELLSVMICLLPSGEIGKPKLIIIESIAVKKVSTIHVMLGFSKRIDFIMYCQAATFVLAAYHGQRPIVMCGPQAVSCEEQLTL